VPAHMVGLPVSATNLSISREGVSYPLLLDTDTFDRAGEDGDIPVLPLNGGDEFVGEALEGQWHKGWDANIDTFTATIDSGVLRLTGVAAVAGTAGDGWINSHHPIPMLDGLELTVSMEVPIDDTGATANRDVVYRFFLRQDKDESDPSTDNNYLRIDINVNESGLRLAIRKEINGVTTTLDSGYDYTMDGTRSTGNLEATIWRLVFNGKPGTPGATLSVYLKQADTLANAETATEHELDGSPYDISDLAFNIGYPSYQIYTQNTTYFGATYDSANRAASGYLRVNYDSSPFKVHYDFTPADYGEGDVMLWDGDPDSGGVRVYDEDHTFANDCYIQNSLLRLHIDEAVQYGLKLYGYYGAAWNQIFDQFQLEVLNEAFVPYPFLRSIIKVSQEEVVILVRFCDTSIEDNNIYIDIELTVKRGSYSFNVKPVEVFPLNSWRQSLRQASSRRFGYLCDDEVGDHDVSVVAVNTTMSDNFGMVFDDAGEPVLGGLSVNRVPNTEFRFNTLARLFHSWFTVDHINDAIIQVSLTPFPLVANLFKEAEDATLAGGATAVADGAASGGQAVLLNAINEEVRWQFNAGTDLPAGRYLMIIRARDTNQVANDFRRNCYDSGDAEFRNEENAQVITTLTASYAYYGMFFFISDADVAATDEFKIAARKITGGANEIYVDYYLVIPISDGMNFPQDLSHGALRGVTQLPRLCER